MPQNDVFVKLVLPAPSQGASSTALNESHRPRAAPSHAANGSSREARKYVFVRNLTFASLRAPPLAADEPLAAYLMHVYRETQLPPAPIDLTSFQWLWWDVPLHVACAWQYIHNVNPLTAVDCTAGAAAGAVDVSPNLGLSHLARYGFSAPQLARRCANATSTAADVRGIEVMRISTRAYRRGSHVHINNTGLREHEGGANGCWYLAARGSGVWLPVRRMLRATRAQLLPKLGIDPTLLLTRDGAINNMHVRNLSALTEARRAQLVHERISTLEDHVALCPYLSAAGYDVLRMLRHDADDDATMHEIVDCRPQCTEGWLKGACVDGLRTGWDGRLPCHCNESHALLNCFGTRPLEFTGLPGSTACHSADACAAHRQKASPHHCPPAHPGGRR